MNRLILLALTAAYGSSAVAADADIAKLFAKNPEYFDMQISPDGKYLAAKSVSANERDFLIFLDTTTMQAVGVAKMPDTSQVGEYRWVNNERVVFKITEVAPWSQEPMYYGELYGVNFDGSNGALLFGYRAGQMQTGTRLERRKSHNAWAEFVDMRANDKKQVLIQSTTQSTSGDSFPEIMALHIKSGLTESRGRVPARYATTLVGADGKPRLATGISKNDTVEVYQRTADSNDWVQLPAQQYGEKFTPIALSADSSTALITDNIKQDKVGVFTLNLATNKYSNVYTDPKVDITSVVKTTDDRSAYAIQVDDGRPAYLLLTEESAEAKIYKELIASFPGERVNITSATDDGSKMIVKVSSDLTPGSYYLFNKETFELKLLANTYQEAAKTKLSPMEPVSFKSFDGKEINGYITKSNHVSDNKPLVVLVHGGPHGVRDYWGFDPEVQMLAAAGYNVLQVNYRGSGGYGSEFERAGYLQWGDAIQRDIIAGTQWAVQAGYAKADNVCIMGTSFGGYSAMMAPIVAPDAYKCAIGVAGVYDLTLMKKTGDIIERGFGEAYLDKVLGNDQAQLKAYSPVYHADKLKANVLLMHGKQDERAPLEHAIKLQDALKSAGKPFEWVQINDEAHGFYGQANREVYYNRVLAFLDKNLKR